MSPSYYKMLSLLIGHDMNDSDDLHSANTYGTFVCQTSYQTLTQGLRE
jgi:hypothetical protein